VVAALHRWDVALTRGSAISPSIHQDGAMLHRNNGLTRLITAGLAIAAIAPAAAVAQPIGGWRSPSHAAGPARAGPASARPDRCARRTAVRRYAGTHRAAVAGQPAADRAREDHRRHAVDG
jgi:hypothetical protein